MAAHHPQILSKPRVSAQGMLSSVGLGLLVLWHSSSRAGRTHSGISTNSAGRPFKGNHRRQAERRRSRAHRCRSESGSSGPSWPPLAALVRRPYSPWPPGSRTPSGGGARWLPASCGAEETQMWCSTGGRRNGASSSGIFVDHRVGFMKVVAKDDCPVPVRRPHRRSHTHTDLINRAVGRAALK